jgi:hypothetical protein
MSCSHAGKMPANPGAPLTWLSSDSFVSIEIERYVSAVGRTRRTTTFPFPYPKDFGAMGEKLCIPCGFRLHAMGLVLETCLVRLSFLSMTLAHPPLAGGPEVLRNQTNDWDKDMQDGCCSVQDDNRKRNHTQPCPTMAIALWMQLLSSYISFSPLERKGNVLKAQDQLSHHWFGTVSFCL